MTFRHGAAPAPLAGRPDHAPSPGGGHALRHRAVQRSGWHRWAGGQPGLAPLTRACVAGAAPLEQRRPGQAGEAHLQVVHRRLQPHHQVTHRHQVTGDLLQVGYDDPLELVEQPRHPGQHHGQGVGEHPTYVDAVLRDQPVDGVGEPGQGREQPLQRAGQVVDQGPGSLGDPGGGGDEDGARVAATSARPRMTSTPATVLATPATSPSTVPTVPDTPATRASTSASSRGTRPTASTTATAPLVTATATPATVPTSRGRSRREGRPMRTSGGCGQARDGQAGPPRVAGPRPGGSYYRGRDGSAGAAATGRRSG